MATNQRQTCMKMFSTDLNSRSSAWDEATMQLDIPSELTNTHLPTYCEIDVVGPTSSQAVKAHLQLPEHVLQEFESDGHPVILHGTLHGLIRTQVDRYVAKQKFLRAKSRFIVSNPSKASLTSMVVCDLKLCTSWLPKSGTLTGRTWISEHTALSDQHIATGKCDVEYWVEFDDLIGPEHSYKSCTSISPVLLSDLDVSPSSIEVKQITTKAKRQNGRLMQASVAGISKALGLSTLTQCPYPNLTFQLSDGRTQQLQHFEGEMSRSHILTLPLLVSIQLPQPTSGQHAMSLTVLRHRLLQRGVVDFGVFTAKFIVKRRFGVGLPDKGYTINKENACVVAEDAIIDLPPFYPHNSKDGEVLAATTEIKLNIPDHLLRNCTTTLDLLQISQSLSLDIRTKQLDAELPGLLPAYSTRLVTNCCLK